jgi:hypothetical protein
MPLWHKNWVTNEIDSEEDFSEVVVQSYVWAAAEGIQIYNIQDRMHVPKKFLFGMGDVCWLSYTPRFLFHFKWVLSSSPSNAVWLFFPFTCSSLFVHGITLLPLSSKTYPHFSCFNSHLFSCSWAFSHFDGLFFSFNSPLELEPWTP